MKVLCLNAGSSSLKTALVVADEKAQVRHGEAEVDTDGGDASAALEKALDKLGRDKPDAVGHRLVHGGPSRTEPTVVTPDVRRALDDAVRFAPLHLPSELAILDAATRAFPGIPQVVCFDTAFHAGLPDVAKRLPIAAWADAKGVRRYGFHGLSYEYVVGHVGKDALGAAAVAHLGSGSSLAAIRDGVSIDTTMGMSPSGGIMMGSRPGDVDPGALVHLMDEEKWTARELEHFINHECGLKGVSTTTSDMRKLLEAREHDESARLAVALFVYIASKAIGGLAVTLGGLRSVVFTGGMGARSAVVRAEIAARLVFLGVTLDAAKNEAHADVISPDGAPCTVRVVTTDEEVVIARHTREAVRHEGTA